LSGNLYEGMFLLDSGRFAADPEGMTSRLLGLLESAGATVDAHRPWQDGRLAYEIQGRRKGLHYLVYFRMAGEGHTELGRLCKLSDVVVRHLIIRHPQVMFDAMVDALTGPTTEQTEKQEVAAADVTATEAKSADDTTAVAGDQAAESPAGDQPQEVVAAVGEKAVEDA